MGTVDGVDDPLEGHGKYGNLRPLGRGGMGEVFEALHVGLGTRVVVKLLHEELADKPHLVDRMRLEAQVLARLRHPNIVRVTDFDTTVGGRPFFVMEYLHGRSLKEEVAARGGALPVPEAIDLVLQALAGLAAAHEAGIVHRDVKLDNLFLCKPPRRASGPDGAVEPSPVVKVLDFGVAKLLASATAAPAPLAVPTGTGVVVGTPRFFAPEQARGAALDHRADIYAVGLVLYNLVGGRGPFDDARSVAEMARAHAFEAPAPLSTMAEQPVPPRLDAIVGRCLRKAPEERFPSADELASELTEVRRAMADDGSAATTAPALPPVQATVALDDAPVEPAPTPLAATLGLDDAAQATPPAPSPLPDPGPATDDEPAALRPGPAAAPARFSLPMVVAAIVVATAVGAALAAAVAALL